MGAFEIFCVCGLTLLPVFSYCLMDQRVVIDERKIVDLTVMGRVIAVRANRACSC